MKRFVFLLVLSNVFVLFFAQDYNTQVVDKKVKDFIVDNDFSTPLNSFVSIQHLLANGRNSELDKKSSFRFIMRNLKRSVDEETTKEFQAELLNCEIKTLITYCDSVAAVIEKGPNEDYYTYRFLNLEQGIWVNGGEDMGEKSLELTDNKIREILPLRLMMLRKTTAIQREKSIQLTK